MPFLTSDHGQDLIPHPEYSELCNLLQIDDKNIQCKCFYKTCPLIIDVTDIMQEGSASLRINGKKIVWGLDRGSIRRCA